jgi:hypothetical protein
MLMVAICLIGVFFGEHTFNRVMMLCFSAVCAYMARHDYAEIVRLVNEIERISSSSRDFSSAPATQ